MVYALLSLPPTVTAAVADTWLRIIVAIDTPTVDHLIARNFNVTTLRSVVLATLPTDPERAVRKGTHQYWGKPIARFRFPWGIAIGCAAYVLLPASIRWWVIAGTLFAFMCLVMTINFFGSRRKARRSTTSSE